jgi:predicted ATPase
MRIVVSGTHASGKSTLIADFAAAHPDFATLPDPFEMVDAAADEPDAITYFAQLQSSSARLLKLAPGARVIAERGPLDFLAYLDALDVLRRPTRAPGLFRQGVAPTAAAMAQADLLVLLPLSSAIEAPDDEDRDLREAMNDALLELADDPDLVADTTVVEITGDRATRLAQLEAAVAQVEHRS